MRALFCLLSIAVIIGSWSCSETIFLPIQGSVEGIITDNNGLPLVGVSVIATFQPPSESGQAFEQTKTATTAAGGIFRFSELWDEVHLAFNHPGFQPAGTHFQLTHDQRRQNIDFTLEGSPTITGINLSKSALAEATPDTLVINVEVTDNFNDLTDGYQSKLLLLENNGSLADVLDLSLESNGINTYLFGAALISGNLSAGVYPMTVEVQDPDGNQHRQPAGELTIR